MTGRARARRSLVGMLAAGVLAPALLTGCAQSVDPIERLGRKAAEKVPTRKPAPSPSCAHLAGPRKTDRYEATETEPASEGKRCPVGREGSSVAPPEGREGSVASPSEGSSTSPSG